MFHFNLQMQLSPELLVIECNFSCFERAITEYTCVFKNYEDHYYLIENNHIKESQSNETEISYISNTSQITDNSETNNICRLTFVCVQNKCSTYPLKSSYEKKHFEECASKVVRPES